MWEGSKQQVKKLLISSSGNWYLLLVTKIQLSCLKDQISFIEWFMY